MVQNGIDVEYAQGYERIESENDEKLRSEAIKVAKNNDVVLVFAGLTENYESEGVDRETLDMPENQNKLIRRFYPKGVDLSNVTQEELNKIQDFMNNMPRKIFNGLSSNQFLEQNEMEYLQT